MIWRKIKSRKISCYYSIVDKRVECWWRGGSSYLLFMWQYLPKLSDLSKLSSFTTKADISCLPFRMLNAQCFLFIAVCPGTESVVALQMQNCSGDFFCLQTQCPVHSSNHRQIPAEVYGSRPPKTFPASNHFQHIVCINKIQQPVDLRFSLNLS